MKREWDTIVQKYVNQYNKGNRTPEVDAVLKVNDLLRETLQEPTRPFRLIYIASPFYHSNEFVVKERVHIANKYAAKLLLQGKNVFSPLTMGDVLSGYMPKEYQWNHDFWLPVDLHMLSKCDELHILYQDGWKESHGVEVERDFASKNNIPIIGVNPNDI